MSRASRRELVAATASRYRASARPEKRRILDEFVAVTGYHRKHAVRILNGSVEAVESASEGGGRPRLYDEAVREALIVLWEASDRVCGKRLKPLLPVMTESLERHGHLHLHDNVRERLFSVSPATIDRLLAPTRLAVLGGQRTRARTATPLRRSVPIKTFADWDSPAPGFMEAALVAHSGEDASGTNSCLLGKLLLSKVVPVIKRTTSESPYAESLAEGEFASLRTKAFFGKCMDQAENDFGWEKWSF